MISVSSAVSLWVIIKRHSGRLVVPGEEVSACTEEVHRSRGRAGLIYHRAACFLPLVSKLSVFSLSFKMDSESQNVVSNECVQRWDELTLWLSRNVATRGKKTSFRAVSAEI